MTIVDIMTYSSRSRETTKQQQFGPKVEEKAIFLLSPGSNFT